MLSRKIFAAILTTIICYFIVPLFFNDYSGSYFLIGFGVSIITVPILFIVGVLLSITIETLNNQQHILMSYFKHLGGGMICVIVFLLITEWKIDVLAVYSGIAITYVTIFFISDYIVKYYENKAI